MNVATICGTISHVKFFVGIFPTFDYNGRRTHRLPDRMAAPPSFTLQPDALLRPLRRLLRPLVRLLIQGGVTFPALADLLRSLYVEVAARR